MKSVLLSIQPKWCELIASGKKTVEIRRTRPKIKTPFKCYIYCTLKGCKEFFKDTLGGDVAKWNKGKWADKKGKVIGEFICDNIDWHGNSVYVIREECIKALEGSCLTEEEFHNYMGYPPMNPYQYPKEAFKKYEFYSWHISNLVIYNKPKELDEFYIVDETAVKECKHRYRTGQPDFCTKNNGWIKGGYICMKTLEAEWCEKCIKKPLKRPPQSWCYVEELE